MEKSAGGVYYHALHLYERRTSEKSTDDSPRPESVAITPAALVSSWHGTGAGEARDVFAFQLSPDLGVVTRRWNTGARLGAGVWLVRRLAALATAPRALCRRRRRRRQSQPHAGETQSEQA